MDTYGGNKSNKNPQAGSGGSVQEGLSDKAKCDPNYVPRTSGQGERPDQPKEEKTGQFTIK